MAAGVARECELDEVLSLDMGGTTAKICLIRDGVPESSRSFETARVYRDQKGSGLPLRVPVIELVEIARSRVFHHQDHHRFVAGCRHRKRRWFDGPRTSRVGAGGLCRIGF